MEAVLNNKLKVVSAPLLRSNNITDGLLNSNYKMIAKQNLNQSSSGTVFGTRQRLKSYQLNKVNHTAVILKLSIFMIAMSLIF